VASTTSNSEESSYSVLGINETPDLPGISPYDLEPGTNPGYAGAISWKLIERHWNPITFDIL
jgi:hypothetical protein